MNLKLAVSQLNPQNPNFNEMVRQNFLVLNDFLQNAPFLNGEFRHYEITLPAAISDYKFAHHFSFIPRDVIQTFLSEGVTLTWAYDAFDRTNIQFTTSAACTVRFFVGRYQKEVGRA